jgi:hypothetical protein
MSSRTWLREVGGRLAGCGVASAVTSGYAQTILIIGYHGDIRKLLASTLVLLFPFLVVFIFIIVSLLTAILAAMVIWPSRAFPLRCCSDTAERRRQDPQCGQLRGIADLRMEHHL